MNFEDASTKLEFQKVLKYVVRHATSEPGRSLLLSTPILTDVASIRSELALVTEMKSLIESEGDLPLEEVKDVGGAVRRAAIPGSILSVKELLDIAGALRVARIMRSFFFRHRQTVPSLWGMFESLYTDKVLEYNIDHAIDPSGAVRSSASKELGRIRRAIVEKYDLLRKRLQGILKDVSDLGLTQDDIITTREGRMVIPVKAGSQKRVPGFIHSSSGSGATVFVEPTETLELNNQITDLQFQERREVDKILGELSAQVGTVRTELLAGLSHVAQIDSLQARARYSIEALCNEPVVSDGASLHFVDARHPLLIASHGYRETVPAEIKLGGTCQTLLISGPNAGGKSVTMKCVGLLTLMAQAGLHIPASSESIVRVFRRVFVDIGDEQSIENDLSTFSSHLKALKQIAEGADDQSLILVDEIGAGTDPAEGGAFAAAILETLTRRKAITIATTHHGFLKVFAHQTEGIQNGAMEFDQSSLQPTYRFKAGVPGSSYALEMARRMKIGDAILERSIELLGHRESRMESLLMELEASSQQYKRDLEELDEKRLRLEALTKEYEGKVAGVAGEIRELRRNAQIETRKIIENANALVEKSIREIRESGAEKETLKSVRSAIADFRDSLEEERVPDREELSPAVDLREGATVTLRTGGETGRVESIVPGKDVAFVQFGNIRMKVNTHDLLPSNVKPPARFVDHGMNERDLTPPLHEVDVRGMSGDEAVQTLDKFIDSAILGGLHRVDIIHGKGTGALRKRVSEFLTLHPRVRSFRLGEWNEGGTGATVVELSD